MNRQQATSAAVAKVLAPFRDAEAESLANSHMRMWAVGSGKGGVGKTLLSASFSLSLAKRGRRVLVIDLDFGGANLHTSLGLKMPSRGLSDWFSERVQNLGDIVTDTPYENLKIISGAQDSLSIIQQVENKKALLLEELKKLPYDDIVFDLGAGTHDLTLYFFLAANYGLVSILPEPTSVENAYRFIRSVLYHRMLNVDIPDGVKEIIQTCFDMKNILGVKTPSDLLAVINRVDEAAALKLKQEIKKFSPHVVINQVRSQVDIDVGTAIKSVCRRYFGIQVNYAGHIDHDNSVIKAVRTKKAALIEFPHSVLSNRIERITEKILSSDKER